MYMSVSIETNTVISADYYGMTKNKNDYGRISSGHMQLRHGHVVFNVFNSFTLFFKGRGD